jgi:hypothetical protein
MKLLLVLLALMCLVVMVLRVDPFKTKKGVASGPRRAARDGLLTSAVIFILRAARAGLALMAVLTGLMAFKLVLVSVATRAGGGGQDIWLTATLLGGICVLFYFLFWTSARIRARVNRMHLERSNGMKPLLARHWSF